MWAFKSTFSGNYVERHDSGFLSASYMFTTNINKALTFSSVPRALKWLQEAVMANVNDVWLEDSDPVVISKAINGVLTLCEVEEYTPPVLKQLRELRVL